MRLLSEEVERLDLKIRRGAPRNGKAHTTRPLQLGALHYLLSNSVYIGKVRHHEDIYVGEHEPIIEAAQFEAVRKLLAQQAPKRSRSKNAPEVHLLKGIGFDETGDRLTTTYAYNHGKRDRYYVSHRLIERRRKIRDRGSGWRIPAAELESLVEDEVSRILGNHAQLIEWISDWCGETQAHAVVDKARSLRAGWRALPGVERKVILQKLFRRIELKPGWINYELDRKALADWLTDGPTINDLAHEANDIVTIERPLSIRRRGVESRIVLTDGTAQTRSADTALIDLIVRANRYLASLTDGSCRSLADIAKEHGTAPSEVSRLLPFAFLSPRIVEEILTGSQPVHLNAQRLSRIADLPVGWLEQAELLGF